MAIIGLEDEQFAVICIYAPAVEVQEQKLSFFEKLNDSLTHFVSDNTILCGDFNVHLGPRDVEVGKYRSTSISKYIYELAEQLSLKDIWREQNPNKTEFTWRRAQPLQQSRIDYIFISETVRCNFDIQSVIEAGVRSDHSVIAITAVSAQRKRGAGLYRFNNELLADPEFVELTREEIQRARTGNGIYNGDIDHGVQVEMLLSNIRVISIRRSKIIAKNIRQEERRLLRQVTEYERDLRKLSESQKVLYGIAKQSLDEITTKRAKRAILASGARWVEEGEKTTAYFLSRGKQLSAQKTISEIKVNDRVIRDDMGILEYCAKHYENIFSSSNVDRTVMAQFLSCEDIPRLSEEESAQCEGNIGIDECKAALLKMNKNKAPGVSGFTPEFFIHFWDDVGSIITSYINHAYSHGFFITQRRGAVTLVPKKGDQSELKNKRPICLLDVIYKVVAKVIASRLEVVADTLISTEQTGFMKGRYIGENLRLISDVIDYCEMDNAEGILLACDYRAAFDSLEHEFIFEVLKAYNFGETLIGWVRLLYKDASLTIMNNGHSSRWFRCKRGTFQGSPLSGILFNLAVEILAINIRKNEEIHGIKVSGVDTKISLYADDMTLLLGDKQSGIEALRIIEEFSKASGLYLNLDKSQAMWLGKGKNKREPIGEILTVDKIKVLGIWFSARRNCTSDNVEPIVKKIDNTINVWNQRSLTIKGRITVTRALIASQFVYMSSCVEMPKKAIRSIQSKIMRFVWRGRPPKVSKDILVQDIEQGGLKLVDVEVFIQSLTSLWIRRMFNDRVSSWRKILQGRIGKLELCDLIRSSLCKGEIKKLRIPAFYQNVLKQFQSYNCRPLNQVANVQREIIWYNRSVRMQGKSVFLYGLYKKGIKYIDDLTRGNGTLMNINELRYRYPGVRIDFLTYEALKRAIPQYWKQILMDTPHMPLSENERRDAPVIYIKGQKCGIDELRSKELYILETVSRTPKAVLRWEELGYSDMEWEHTFVIPYRCTKSTQLQSLQYRIIHRYIPTRRYLYIRKLITSPECLKCAREDTLEHFLYQCSVINSIWIRIFRMLGIARQNILKNVLFGMVDGKQAINLIILLVKQYIVRCKLSYEQIEPCYEGARASINNYILMEKYAATDNNAIPSFDKKWQGMLNNNGEWG